MEGNFNKLRISDYYVESEEKDNSWQYFDVGKYLKGKNGLCVGYQDDGVLSFATPHKLLFNIDDVREALTEIGFDGNQIYNRQDRDGIVILFNGVGVNETVIVGCMDMFGWVRDDRVAEIKDLGPWKYTYCALSFHYEPVANIYGWKHLLFLGKDTEEIETIKGSVRMYLPEIPLEKMIKDAVESGNHTVYQLELEKIHHDIDRGFLKFNRSFRINEACGHIREENRNYVEVTGYIGNNAITKVCTFDEHDLKPEEENMVQLKSSDEAEEKTDKREI